MRINAFDTTLINIDSIDTSGSIHPYFPAKIWKGTEAFWKSININGYFKTNVVIVSEVFKSIMLTLHVIKSVWTVKYIFRMVTLSHEINLHIIFTCSICPSSLCL